MKKLMEFFLSLQRFHLKLLTSLNGVYEIALMRYLDLMQLYDTENKYT